jgi:hypothetical integral membrane protein (TIGR02206 family)
MPATVRPRVKLGSVRQFSPEHLAAMAAMVAAMLRPPPRRVLAAVMAGAFVTEQIAYLVTGEWRATLNLPLQLSDAVTFVAIAALWRPRPALEELLWFWALTASLQATLTPDLAQSFPDVRYFTYFLTHGGALVAVVVLHALPRPGGMWRAYAATVAWAALAAAGDLITGGNYMFLREKPSTASLLDLMGPWPVYIAAAAVLALALFAALQAIGDALRRSSPG